MLELSSDLGHFTNFGIEQFSKYVNNFLNSKYNSEKIKTSF